MIGGISCSGTESNLTECNSPGHTGLLDCVHRRAVGVLCQGLWIIHWVKLLKYMIAYETGLVDHGSIYDLNFMGGGGGD